MKALAALGGVSLLFLLAILGGLALSTLWGWFIVPVFGAPALSIPQAIGVSLVVALLTHQQTPEDKEEGALLRAGARAVVLPLAYLFFGWIVHLFL